MRLQAISLLALSTYVGSIYAAPIAGNETDMIDVSYTFYYADGTISDEIRKEPRDNRYTELSRRSLDDRALNQFYDWDKSNVDDQNKIKQIVAAQHDGVELADYVIRNFASGGIYDHYFGPNDKDKVKQVYQNIVGPTNSDGTGSAALGNVYWDKTDFLKVCIDVGKETSSSKVVIAYARNGKLGSTDNSLNHMCGQAFLFKGRDDIKCANLGDTVSFRMNILGGVMIHEWTHFKSIAGFLPGVDKDQGTKDNAYGPLKVKGLSAADKLVNADSYRWFALEMFWHIICTKDFSGPRDNRDVVEPECGKATSCTIQ